MKEIFYITAFAVLGIELQFLAHAGLEVWYIGLLLDDFQKYNLGFSWEQLEAIHIILSIVLLAALPTYKKAKPKA